VRTVSCDATKFCLCTLFTLHTRSNTSISRYSQKLTARPNTLVIIFWPYGMYEATYQRAAHHCVTHAHTHMGEAREPFFCFAKRTRWLKALAHRYEDAKNDDDAGRAHKGEN
jgi:hypothetical protein